MQKDAMRKSQTANHSKGDRGKLFFRCAIIVIIVAIGAFVGLTVASRGERRAEERDDSLNLSYDTVSDEDKQNYKVNDGAKPRLITIPSIDVSARIQEIGLLSASSDGTRQMDVPRNVHDAGWYNCEENADESDRCNKFISPNGVYNDTSAVIDGHSCSDKGCVFDKLDELADGAEIKIELGNGNVVSYFVDHVETVDLSEVNMEKVMTPVSNNRAGLALITCDGSWTTRDSRGVRSMDKRVIVYASAK